MASADSGLAGIKPGGALIGGASWSLHSSSHESQNGTVARGGGTRPATKVSHESQIGMLMSEKGRLD